MHTGHVLSFVFDIAAADVADIGAETRRAVRDPMKGSTFLETRVRDIKALLLDENREGTEYGPDAVDADVVMLWDDNGRRVAAGTSYGSSDDGYVETDPSFVEIAQWLDEDW